MNMKIEERKI